MRDIPDHLLAKIESIINSYSLFPERTAYVSYSGGKDSLFLCAALSQLGYSVHPVTIDVGFGADWSIARKNIHNLGLEFLLIDKEYVDRQFPHIAETISRNLDLFRRANVDSTAKATVCTYCYNSKILILKHWAETNGVQEIAFGHHGTDAIASLLKSFYMYVDRWYHNNLEFSREHYKQLLCEDAEKYHTEASVFLNSELYKKIRFESQRKNIGTDEPIKQHISGSKIAICRPMYRIFENEIKNYYLGYELEIARSECFTTGSRQEKVRSPRELIQDYLLAEAEPEVLKALLDITFAAIDTEGFLLYNVRNLRSEILGAQYKSGLENNIKL